MEAYWIADRALLRSLVKEHPTWSHHDLAEAVGRSVSWVKKWIKRFEEAPPDDREVLFSRSRAHHVPYPRPHPKLVERIVEMREHPPEGLQRVPGPRALLYYLPRDPELQEQQVPLPRSTRTIWKILRAQGCIFSSSRPQRRPLAPVGPLEEIQLNAQGRFVCANGPFRKAATRGRGSQLCRCWYFPLAWGRGARRFSCRNRS